MVVFWQEQPMRETPSRSASPPHRFRPRRAASDLAGLSGIAWTSHFVKQNYEGDWSVIALRAPAGARHPIQMIVSEPGQFDFVDTPPSPPRPISGRCWRPLPARCWPCG